jgi:hypothetical protein
MLPGEDQYEVEGISEVDSGSSKKGCSATRSNRPTQALDFDFCEVLG